MKKNIAKKFITFIKKRIFGFFLFCKQWIVISRLVFWELLPNKRYILLKFQNKINLWLFFSKRFILALKYKCTISGIIKHLFIFCLVFCISYTIFSRKDIESQLTTSLYAVLGFVFSLYATYLYEKIINLCDEFRHLPLLPQILSSIYGMSSAVYKSFFTHPLDDKICKKGQNIIYVHPCKAGGGFDENLMMTYTNWVSNIDITLFYKHFRPEQTRELIKHLKDQSFYFNNTYSLVLAQKNYLNQNLFIIFSQFYEALNAFMYLDLFKWEDSQIKENIFMAVKILIYRTNITILSAQKELKKIEQYTNYIASAPIQIDKNLNKNADKIQKDIKLASEKYINILNKFNKADQKYILDTMFKILNILKRKDK